MFVFCTKARSTLTPLQPMQYGGNKKGENEKTGKM
jgi:hypothetical protein